MSLVPKYKYLGNYPENRENGWSDELQGVCHDENFWYFSQNNHDSCSKKTGRIWKFPIEHNLNKEIESPQGRITRITCGNHHLGDMDYYKGYLFVPLEKYIVVFTDNLKPLSIFDFSKVGQNYASTGWCAVNPNDGRLYTSNRHIGIKPDDEYSLIHVYDINIEVLDKLKSKRPFFSDTECDIKDFVHSDFLTYAYDLSPYIVDDYDAVSRLTLTHTQGGCFDNSNLLHLVTGVGRKGWIFKKIDKNSGISVFNVPKVDKGSYKVKKYNIVRVAKSEQKGGFQYQFDGSAEEPEGITYWDLHEDTRAPDIFGDLHVIMIDNCGALDDDFYFKHYKRVGLTETDKYDRIQNPERKYFLNRREQEGREHEMHMEGCSHMPAEKNLIPLGVFVTMEDAMEKAKTIFPQVDGCYFCCRRLDSDRKRQRIE